MLLFGGIFYAIFAEGTVQSWADEENKNDSDENASFKFWRKSKQTAILFNFIIKNIYSITSVTKFWIWFTVRFQGTREILRSVWPQNHLTSELHGSKSVSVDFKYK